ncbi:hypothetical protein [Alkalihalobacillus sp. R86527]|uniref:hypothetical protein n=1 Tax=Alkalihalobacillus sp. R86527 TaxID=3093863 RepID=UPI00366E3447
MRRKCPECGGEKFDQGTDHMPIRPMNKKFSMKALQKIYTFCLGCGEIVSTKVENPTKLNN